jgi:predicted nucleic-acid-binding Zn-ribbon protein
MSEEMSMKDKWQDAGCPKCSSPHFDERVVDEVGGEAVGPYVVFECEDCMYAEYDHT